MGIYRTYVPQLPLAAFVDHFWSYEGESVPYAKERRLPRGALEVIINLQVDALRVYDGQDESRFQSFSGCLVVGAYSKFFVIDTACQASLVGINFKPGGVASFLPWPTNELYNTHVSLDALWGTLAGELRDQLLAVNPAEARLRILERFLLARAKQPLIPHPVVAFALTKLQCSPHPCTVAEVTEQIGYSSRHFIQMFNDVVGLTPKQFYRVRRFQEALHLIEQGKQLVWADIASACGYFDQAHFIHDFRDFSGITPGTYLAHRGKFRNHIPLPD